MHTRASKGFVTLSLSLSLSLSSRYLTSSVPPSGMSTMGRRGGVGCHGAALLPILVCGW